MPKLFRRRQVWLPTWSGAVVLLAIAIAVALLVLPQLGRFLAPDAPAREADGGAARTVVIEGWLDDRALDDAIALVQRRGDARIVTSGGPIESWRELQPWPTYADRAADYLRRHGGARTANVVAIPAPAVARDRSYASAVVVRDRLLREDPALRAIDVVSGGVHARRSRLVYRLAFGSGVDVGIVAVPRGEPRTRWWQTSEDAKAVVGELLSLAWTACCFWPPATSTSTSSTSPPASTASAGRRSSPESGKRSGAASSS